MNPFADDPDRCAIWEMLMMRDFEAFAAGDWTVVEKDFDSAVFFGVHGRLTGETDRWEPSFHTLAAYRDEWLRRSAETAAVADMGKAKDALLASATLGQIDISGDFAVAHKKFDGHVPHADGVGSMRRLWQTLYMCRKKAGTWKIAGFVGYLPNPMPGAS